MEAVKEVVKEEEVVEEEWVEEDGPEEVQDVLTPTRRNKKGFPNDTMMTISPVVSLPNKLKIL